MELKEVLEKIKEPERLIELTKGKFAIVDDELFDYLNQWKWHLTTSGYAARRFNFGYKDAKVVFMHRLIIPVPYLREVDHINGNKLDNRKGNLRVASRTENNKNRKKKRNATSLFYGVDFNKIHKKWRSRVGKFQVGLFDNERHAAMARDIWVRGDKFNKLNFPFALWN